jgi:hypothetical protein
MKSVRKMENLPPVDGGDELLRPLNMSPINPAIITRARNRPHNRTNNVFRGSANVGFIYGRSF